MATLVTGSAGRVGRRVVAALLEQGERVIGLDLRPNGTAHPDYREILGRFDDAATVTQAMAGAEAVIHLGAFMSWQRSDVPQIHATNVDGTFRLLEAAVQSPVRRFIFASSGEVYPEGRPRYLPIDEAHPQSPTSFYGQSKQLGESMVGFQHRVNGLPTVILRFAHTQEAEELLDTASFFSGPRFYLRAKIRQQERLGNERLLGLLRPLDDGTDKLLVQCGEDGRPYRMMIADARDICAGVMLALASDRAVGMTMNLGPDEPVRMDEAVALLQQATGLPVVRANLPGPAVDYVTSNALARATLGYAPRHSFAGMVAAARRGTPLAGRG